MKRTSFVHLGLTALVAAGLSFGCASSGTETTMEKSSDWSAEPTDRSEGSISGTEVSKPAAELEAIYFDFDMALIRDDQKPTLRANATSVLNRRDWNRITIEGHCDERGSEEYNLALGERRANAVKRYLESLGISSGKLDTVSFGEAKPAVRGHDESAWRWNRRAEFRVEK